MAAVENPGNLWISQNTGVNWFYVQNAPQTAWNAITSSSSGNVFLAVSGNGNTGNIYKFTSPLISDPPFNITATTNSQNNTVNVSWTAPVNIGGSAIQTYIVKMNPGRYINLINAPTLSATINGLSTATTYNFSVYALNSQGLSYSYSSASATTYNFILITGTYKTYNFISPTSANWAAIAMDASGINMVAVPNTANANIWVSTNSSLNWTEIKQFGAGFTWSAVACSQTGSIMTAAATPNANIWVSTNTGTNWFNTNIRGSNWSSITINANGGNIYVTDYGGNIWFSTSSGSVGLWINSTVKGNWSGITTNTTGDFGNTLVCSQNSVIGNINCIPGIPGPISTSTWSAAGNSNKKWFNCTMNDVGNRMIATDYNNNSGYIFYSTNYGVNWNQSNLQKNWRGCAMNSIGDRAIALVANVSDSFYYSTNYGANWIPSSTSANQNWVSCAMNSVGDRAIASAASGNIFYSSNYGVNWLKSSLAAKDFRICAMNSIGDIGIAADFNYGSNGAGYIYYSNNYGVTWSQSNSKISSFNCAINSIGNIAIAGGSNATSYSTSYGVFWTTTYAITFEYVSINSVGDKMLGVTYNGSIYYSTNNGYYWNTSYSSTLTWVCCKLNSFGNIAIAVTNNTNNPIYYSIGYPPVYSISTTVGSPTANWISICSNTLGNIRYAAAILGNLYFSTNSGTNWSNIMVNNNGSRPWKSITCNTTGNIVAAVENPGNLWISSNTGSFWTSISNAPINSSWNAIASNQIGNVWSSVIGNGGNIFKITI
jgi:hypothetical protein